MRARAEQDALDRVLDRVRKGDKVDVEAACAVNALLAGQLREGIREIRESRSVLQRYGAYDDTPLSSISSKDYKDWNERIGKAIPAAISAACSELEFNYLARNSVGSGFQEAREKPRRQMGVVIESLVDKLVKKREAARDAQAMLENIWSTKATFALYLRSFSLESEVSWISIHGQQAKKIYGTQSTFKFVSSSPQTATLEDLLQASLATIPVIKVHGPESIHFTDRSLGALDEEWREVVRMLVKAAAVIFIAYDVVTPGLEEEIHLIKDCCREESTFVIRLSGSGEVLPFQQITVTETAILGPDRTVPDWNLQQPGDFAKVPPAPTNWWVWGNDRELLWAHAHLLYLQGRDYANSLLLDRSIDVYTYAASSFIKLESLTYLALCTLELSRCFKGLGDYRMAAEHAKRALQIPGYQPRDWLLEAAQEWGICVWLMANRVFEVDAERMRELGGMKARPGKHDEAQEVIQMMEEAVPSMRTDVAKAYRVSQELFPSTATPEQTFRNELLRHLADTNMRSRGRPESWAAVRALYESYRDTGQPLFADGRFLAMVANIARQRPSWWQQLRIKRTLSKNVYGMAASPFLAKVITEFLRGKASESDLRLRITTPDAEYELDRLIDAVQRW